MSLAQSRFIALAAASAFASLICVAATPARAVPPSPGGIAPPKLVVMLMVDGLPNEQLTKNYDLFVPNGFRRLMDHGAWFSDAHQGHAYTVTAVGHTAMVTGAYPYQHGIIANEWRNRAGKKVYCTEDTAHHYLDGTPTTDDDGTSPKNLKVSTIGDELRYSNNNASRVFTVTGKDRASILMGGKTGTAYMMSMTTGRFTSTSYYMKAHPEWWEKYYADKPQDAWFHKTWEPLLPAEAYQRSLPDGQPWASSYKGTATRFPLTYGAKEETPGKSYYGTLLVGPYGDLLMADFTMRLVDGERIGRNPSGAPDILGLSFSGHDYINHRFGPESIQSQDHLIRLDRALAALFDYLDKTVGRDNILVAMSADHGFMNAPEYSAGRGFDAKRIDYNEIRAALNKAAEQKFGLPKAVTQYMTGGFTIDYAAIDAKELDREAVETFLARQAEELPGIAFAFTRSQLSRGQMPATRVGLLVTRAWNRQMAIDLAVVQKPFQYFQTKDSKDPNTASHGTPYSYDTNVPLLFQGANWIKPGRYTEPAEVVDVASTLSAILHIRPPSAAEGRARTEILREPAAAKK